MSFAKHEANYGVLPGVEEVAQAFYQSESGLMLPQYYRSAGSPKGMDSVLLGSTQGLHAPEWVRQDASLKQFFGKVSANLEVINSSLQVTEEGGDAYECAIIRSNSESRNKNGAMLHISTYSSSISTNPGNAFEFAVQAALYPDMDHIYVASPGNGGSTSIRNVDMQIGTPHGLMDQREYFKKTGRTTYEDGSNTQPLPYLANMQKALEKLSVDITGFIGTDSAGGSYATGLALAMQKDQLTHAFFSERSNFMRLGRGSLAYGMLVTENVHNSNRMKGIVIDGLRVVDPISVNAPRIDKPGSANVTLVEECITKAQEFKKNSMSQQIGAMVTSLTALSRGSEEYNNNLQNPLVADVNAMIARHPNGMITFSLAEFDPLYKGQADKLAQRFLASIDVQQEDVRAIILEKLPHAYHTHLPLLQDTIRRQAFGLAA